MENSFISLNERALLWAEAKGIFKNGTDLGQALKTVEEANELFSATVDGDIELQKDAIGDIFVCITIMAFRLNLNPLDCFESALEVIEKRNGNMINGQFVRNN